MGQKSRYVLPEVVDPDRVCFQIMVPNDLQHIAAFKGAIYGLSKAYEWQNDPAHTAKDVAAVWLDVFNNMGACDVIQFRQSDDCTLQVSYDSGSTWSSIFNALDCVYGGIIDKIDDGTLSPGGQQPPIGGSGTPGQCYSYHVKLDGNGRWQSPVPVVTGDVVTISNAKGGWYDGNAITLGQWNCPDGSGYVLGECGVASVGPQVGDPAPTLNHMRLIGNVASESPAFFDMYNTSYTLASTSTDGTLFLQCNDTDTSDNQGSITFDVEICKGGWVSVMDFKTGTFGWTLNYGTYSAGIGVRSVFVDSFSQSNVEIELVTTSFHVKQAQWIYQKPGGSGPNNGSRLAIFNPGGILYGTVHTDDGAPVTITETHDYSGLVKLNLALNSVNTNEGNNLILEKLTIWGVGTKPPELP